LPGRDEGLKNSPLPVGNRNPGMLIHTYILNPEEMILYHRDILVPDAFYRPHVFSGYLSLGLSHGRGHDLLGSECRHNVGNLVGETVMTHSGPMADRRWFHQPGGNGEGMDTDTTW